MNRIKRSTAELTGVELARLEAFGHRSTRDDYLAAHLLVREVARRSGAVAGPLTLVQQCRTCGHAHGEPRFAESPCLRVSLSHTAGAVLAAVSSQPVGADIERENFTAPEEIQPVLDVAEIRYLSSAPSHEAIRVWCRKEAAVKVMGHGIAAMASVATIAAGEPARRWGKLVWSEQRSHGYLRCVVSRDTVQITSIESG